MKKKSGVGGYKKFINSQSIARIININELYDAYVLQGIEKGDTRKSNIPVPSVSQQRETAGCQSSGNCLSIDNQTTKSSQKNGEEMSVPFTAEPEVVC